jgi:DNA-damage-inducible protein J
MAKSAMIRARTEKALKQDTDRIFKALGLSLSEAINLFLRQVKLQKGIPFDVKMPNQTTLKAMKDVHTKKNLAQATDLDDLFKKLGI